VQSCRSGGGVGVVFTPFGSCGALPFEAGACPAMGAAARPRAFGVCPPHNPRVQLAAARGPLVPAGARGMFFPGRWRAGGRKPRGCN
jgi:hypothetical protein